MTEPMDFDDLATRARQLDHLVMDEAWKQLRELRDKLTKLTTAADKVVDGFAVRVFIRNASADHEPGWALKVATYIDALAKLQRAADEAREQKGAK